VGRSQSDLGASPLCVKFKIFAFLVVLGVFPKIWERFPKVRVEFVLARIAQKSTQTCFVVFSLILGGVPKIWERFPKVRVTKRTLGKVRVRVRFGQNSLLLPPGIFYTKFEVNRPSRD
jgi:hypothetical protein